MSSLLFVVTTSLLLLLPFLSPVPAPSSPSAAAAPWQASTPEGMLMEDKIRLGSTPPSCRSRCNACSPCMAVQVPTMPGGGGIMAAVRPSASRGRSKATAAKPGPLVVGVGRRHAHKFESAAPATATKTTPLDVGGDASYRSYPNYKPLGWKCRCGDHLYNP